MQRYSTHAICFISFLVLIVATGCSDSGEKSGSPRFTPPTMLSVAPLTGASGACTNTIITATFDKAMNPDTINARTFTVNGPAAAAVSGQVTYSSSSNTAIFTPSGSLAPNTLYTAKISTRAKDKFQCAGKPVDMELHHGRDSVFRSRRAGIVVGHTN